MVTLFGKKNRKAIITLKCERSYVSTKKRYMLHFTAHIIIFKGPLALLSMANSKVELQCSEYTTLAPLAIFLVSI